MKIKITAPVVGENWVHRAGVYNAPADIPIERAKMLVKAGHAVSLDTETRETATDKKAKAEKR